MCLYLFSTLRVLSPSLSLLQKLNQSTESRKRSSVSCNLTTRTHSHTVHTLYYFTPQDGEEELQSTKRFRSSLSPASEIERVPRLDREFRRPPPPHQNKRRMPSRGHLQASAAASPMDIGPVVSGINQALI